MAAAVRCDAASLLLTKSVALGTGAPEEPAAGSSTLYCTSGAYSASGASVADGRDFADAHLRACMHAGIRISGSAPFVLQPAVQLV